jgi:hypothetical protein
MAVNPENYFTGDGSTTSYVFTFEYIDEDDVKVSLDGSVTTAYSFANATTILFNTAPASDVAIRIYRDTNVDELKSTFFAGSSIRAQDLNQNFEQNNFAVQEIKAYTWDNETQTIHSDETWVSSDIQIATTAAMDQRFQDEVNDTLTKAELAALSDVIPDNDDAVPTTGAVKDYVDHVIETDILVDGTGLNKTGASGQVTIGISAGSVDLDRIKPADIVDSTEAWSATNTQVATTQAIEDRIDEIITNDIGTDGTGITVTDDGDGTITLGLANNSIDLARIKNADIITSGETDPDNDVTIATTAKIGDMIDVAIANDITSDGSGITVTDDGDGTITLSVEAGALNLNRINAGNIVTQSEQDGGATENDTTIFTTLAAAKRFDTLVQTANPGLVGNWETGKTWLQNDDDLTLSVWNGTGWVAITSGGTFTSQPNVVYVDVASGDDNNNGHRISTPKASITSAIEQINGEISLSTTVADGFNGGSGYVDAVYSNVSLTHSSGTGIGTGLTASITVSSGAVTAITLSAAQQTALEEYSIGDVLTASNADLGGSGSGLLIPITGAGDGQIVVVSAGVYQEIAPIQIKRRNVSIIGQALRSCIVHPTQATETNNLFELNSGSYLSSMTFTGIKAGTGTGNTLDATLPTTQGWNAAFYSGAFITKSPYIQNCTNFSDSEIDNSDLRAHRPRGGAAGDTDSAPTGGGLLVNGATPATSSPLRSMVCDSYTHVALNGPGILVTNNGYAQCTSSYAFFNKYHIKCLNGGQANLAASTTDFGDQALVADGRSTTAIFTAALSTAASDQDITFTIDAPTADASWHGSETRPQSNMLVELNSITYPILSATANGGGWDVTISRPNPNNRSENLGLNGAVATPATASFFLRSQIASSGHTMEYVGSGTNYNALPENGGVPDETKQITESNNGKVWTAITDHNGKFKIGGNQTTDPIFEVDQQTGFITIPEGSIAFNLLSDTTPQLGGNLDVNGNTITGLSNPTANDEVANKAYVDSVAGTPTQIAELDTSVVVSDSATDGTITFTNDGSESARFDSTGRLLVGATSFTGPTKLVVRGNSSAATGSGNAYLVRGESSADMADNDLVGLIRFSDQDANRSAEIRSSIDGTPSASASPGDLSFWTTAASSVTPTQRMTINSSGNVGVGTTSPEGKIHIESGSSGSTSGPNPNADELVIENSGNAGLTFITPNTSNARINFSDPEHQQAGMIFYDHSTNHLQLNVNATEALRIDSSGRVGIGTSSPSSIFDVQVNTSAGINFTNSGQAPIIDFLANSVESAGRIQSSESLGGGQLLFATKTTGGTLTNRLLIDESGRVGIGTTSPAVNLHVNAANATFDLQDSGATNSIGRFINASGSLYIQSQNNTSHGNIVLRTSNGSSALERARIDSSGNVGIGVSTPAHTLHVRGPSSGTILNLDRGGSYSWKFGQSTGSHLTITGDTTERFRFGPNGQLGIGGANYGTSGQVLTSQGSGSAPQWATPAGATYGSWIAAGTTQYKDFTGISSSTKKVTINVYNWSPNGGYRPTMYLGDSGGFETSGYGSTGYYQNGGSSGSYQNFTGEFRIPIGSASHSLNGRIVIFKMHDTSHVYIAEAYFGDSGSALMCGFGGRKQLSGVLTQIRLGWDAGASDTGAFRVVQE